MQTEGKLSLVVGRVWFAGVDSPVTAGPQCSDLCQYKEGKSTEKNIWHYSSSLGHQVLNQ
jgi:hypothetical protein